MAVAFLQLEMVRPDLAHDASCRPVVAASRRSKVLPAELKGVAIGQAAERYP